MLSILSGSARDLAGSSGSGRWYCVHTAEVHGSSPCTPTTREPCNCRAPVASGPRPAGARARHPIPAVPSLTNLAGMAGHDEQQDRGRPRTTVEASQELGRAVENLGREVRSSAPGRALERCAEAVVDLLAAGLEAVRRGR